MEVPLLAGKHPVLEPRVRVNEQRGHRCAQDGRKFRESGNHSLVTPSITSALVTVGLQNFSM